VGHQGKGRRNLRPSAITTAVATLLLTTLCWATWVKGPEPAQSSGVSGAEGSQQSALSTNGPYYALRSFKFWDYDQRLCVIEASQSSFNAESVTPAGTIKICEQSLGAAWKAVDLGAGRFVTAVQVCTQKAAPDEQRVRGVRLWGSVVDTDGKIKPKGEPVSFEFPDCKKWQPKKSCPKGTVAVGLKAHHADAAKGLLGIELSCQSVVQQKE
jgi:hypothetical protein